jgi:hypothetical protein
MHLLLAALAIQPVAGDAAAPPVPVVPVDPAAPVERPVPQDTPKPDDERLSQLEKRLGALERENKKLKREVADLRDEHDSVSERLDGVLPLVAKVGGYVDFGFFYAMGDGSGIRPDTNYQHFPQYQGIIPGSWVFYGDPLSTTVNSRGEPADTGESRAITFDGVDASGDNVNAGGRSSFIVNAVNLHLFTGIGKHASFEGLVDFVPRARNIEVADDKFAFGDYVDVKLAFVRYQVPTRRVDLDLYAGKIDPVFGYEYRIQESPSRIGVTPSLICRYTCGRPVGLKMRLRMLPKRSLSLAISATNGSSFTEQFGFANEIDRNHFKTAAGRLAYTIPLGAGLDVGASGSVGAQDFQSDELVLQKQFGFDMRLDARGVDFAAEFVMGELDGKAAPGEVACGIAPCLDFKGAYGLLGYRALNWLMPFARVDWRQAIHRSGASFVYHSNSLRITPGVRFEVGAHVMIKAEYSVNLEVGGIPSIRNDVFTSSLVAKI